MGKYKPGINKTKEPEPTSPSEVNIVLLGRTGAGKSASGNTILGEKKFESKFGAKSKTRECKEATALVSGRQVTVLDTPGLYDTKHGMERIEDEIQKVKEFSRRGRCIFLPVIELGRFTEEEEKSIEKILGSFAEEPLNKFMILFTNGDKLEGQPIQEFLEEADENLLGVLHKFGNRYHVFNNKSNPEDRQVEELLMKINDMFMGIQNFSKVTKECFTGPEELNEIELIWQEMDLDRTMSLEGEDEETLQEPRRLVLLGKTGTGKSATGNTILGRDGFESKGGVSAVTKQCQKLEGVVCGRNVAVVDTPGFFGNSGSKEDITQEVVKSVCLSAPGPHAFILVMSLNERLTTDAKDTIKELHNRFGEDFRKHTIILFSHLDKLDQNETVNDLIKSDPEFDELLCPFENRIHTFDNNNRNNRGQVKELLEKIDNMVKQNGGGYYTDEMYRKAEEAIAREAKRLFKKHAEEIFRRAELLQKKNATGNRAGKDGNGAGKDGNGAGKDGNGAGEDGNGAGEDGNGAGEDGNGAGEDGNGAGKDGNGAGKDGNGAGEDGNGAGEDGNGAGEDGNGAGEDGNGAGEDGNGAGEDGNGAGEDGNGDSRWTKLKSILRKVCRKIAEWGESIFQFLRRFSSYFRFLN